MKKTFLSQLMPTYQRLRQNPLYHFLRRSNTLEPTGTDAGEFSVQPDICAPIQQGQSCIVEVTYAPANVKTSEAQIVIQSNDQVKLSVTVRLKGKSK